MILLIDNYDSFTYNVYQRIGSLGHSVCIRKNDEIDFDEIDLLNPSHIIISPGPMGPKNSKSVFTMIDYYKNKVPMLGICLGMQILYCYYGGRVSKSINVIHGKMSRVKHNGGLLFKGIPQTFNAMRYHSLSIDLNRQPKEIDIIAYSEDHVPMGFENIKDRVYGVQFHPEAHMTKYGDMLLGNFCSI